MQRLIDGFMAHAPTAALLILVVIAGLILSRTLARLVRWAVDRMGLEALAEKLGVSRLLYGVGVRVGLARLVEKLAYYTGLLATLVVASEVVGLDGVSDAIGRVVGFLPQLIIAVAILLAGARIAEWVRALLVNADREAGGLLDAPKAVGQVAYYAVLVITFTIAADQLGLETTLVNNIIQIIVAAMAFGAAVALALGARASLSGVIARFYVAQLFRPGDRVRVRAADVDGTVLRFAATSMAVQTTDGVLLVPCSQVLESVVRLERRPAAMDQPEPPSGAAD